MAREVPEPRRSGVRRRRGEPSRREAPRGVARRRRASRRRRTAARRSPGPRGPWSMSTPIRTSRAANATVTRRKSARTPAQSCWSDPSWPMVDRMTSRTAPAVPAASATTAWAPKTAAGGSAEARKRRSTPCSRSRRGAPAPDSTPTVAATRTDALGGAEVDRPQALVHRRVGLVAEHAVEGLLHLTCASDLRSEIGGPHPPIAGLAGSMRPRKYRREAHRRGSSASLPVKIASDRLMQQTRLRSC